MHPSLPASPTKSSQQVQTTLEARNQPAQSAPMHMVSVSPRASSARSWACSLCCSHIFTRWGGRAPFLRSKIQHPLFRKPIHKLKNIPKIRKPQFFSILVFAGRAEAGQGIQLVRGPPSSGWGGGSGRPPRGKKGFKKCSKLRFQFFHRVDKTDDKKKTRAFQRQERKKISWPPLTRLGAGPPPSACAEPKLN